MIRSRLTPIRVAISGSWATARIPRPSLVVATRRSSPIIMSTPVAITRTSSTVTWATPEVEQHVLAHQGRDLDRVAPAHYPDGEDLLERERRADGGDERRQAAGPAPPEGPVGDPLQQEGGAARGDHGRHHSR